ncbi:PREDICTED: natural cytotoxicity triggering receptor 3 ligand 1-like [Chinchilla lanigera]|uniref:natural cytotoxicity triggering receptor 3 ligand 1-like n=1 Tax=Chinchilla lanigera TaxID=34839 RepID=UPI00038F1883|nr:PREDICTED: natural cytotoxicity triggering receptor 3 ligand 1-like [Chinchilla lanigera]XP_005380438.1 PREDICTED: natural cytotoxicity triggering receptor 3 ligand 1-like [Chinchilla lanigera]XP_013367483.1 PREDICTED: natural cytotoxicity triggering receptor 3 ligand 1-like [Chinchilla lanigera]
MAQGSAVRLRDVLRLLLWCGALRAAGSLKVEVPGRPLTVRLNDNVTIPCKVHDFPMLDLSCMGIRWYWKDPASEAEDTVLELYGDNEKVTRTGAKVSLDWPKSGDASLHLPGVQVGDAGMYRCQVVVPPQMEEGVASLEVTAEPASTVFLEQSMERSNEIDGSYLVCHASGFYPEAINITWQKWTQNVSQYQRISTDIWNDPIIKNEGGTFNITSYLKISPSLEDSVTIYQCVVWHCSLNTSQRLNFTLPVRETKERDLIWILVSIVGLILIVVISVCIWRRCRSCKHPAVTLKKEPQPNQVWQFTEITLIFHS